MNKVERLFIPPIVGFLALATAWPRDILPIVSTNWLSQNLGNAKIIVLDIRSAEQYKKGHILGSISAPLNVWAVESKGLNLELPSDSALTDLLGKLGIKDGVSNSVVVVGRVETDFGRADATRVAWTCMVAGLKNVAVLSGGYTKWKKENRSVSTDMPNPASVVYKGMPNRSWVASKGYVLSRIGKSIVVDTRVPEEYFGVTLKPGHIKSAVNLPTPWVFTADGVFKDETDLRAMAKGVLGKSASKEVLVYCGVGGYASTWWFLLTQVFGYKNVKLYDGGMEEWMQDPNAPVGIYSWH
jgi:thiosulfate/3-mercaptopyruvate sulfurtransferase